MNRITFRARRYGGEEFAWLMPHTYLDGAVVHLEHLREIAAQIDIPTAKGSAHLTGSIGVALAEVHRENISQTLLRADAVFYAAKNAGGNSLVEAAPLPDMQFREAIWHFTEHLLYFWPLTEVGA